MKEKFNVKYNEYKQKFLNIKGIKYIQSIFITNKKVIIISLSITLLITFISFLYSQKIILTDSEKILIKKTLYNEKGEYIWPLVQKRISLKQWENLITSRETLIPPNKVLVLLSKWNKNLTKKEIQYIRDKLNNPNFNLTKEEALKITKTIVIVDSSLPYIEEFKKNIISKNPYEDFTFLDINSSKAQSLIKESWEKYISTPLFIYGDKNPNIVLEPWKSYFFPKSEWQFITHTIKINKEILTIIQDICKDLLILKWQSDKWLNLLALWRKGIYQIQKLYDDIKLTDKNVCFIPEDKDIWIITSDYIQSNNKLLYFLNSLSNSKEIKEVQDEKNKDIINKIKLVNAVIKNKTQFYYIDEKNTKLYMLNKIQFKN